MTWKQSIFGRVWPWALIFMATAFVYFPALHGERIMDDAEHITPQSLQSLRGLVRIWCEWGATPHYYPVLNSVFWCEHRLWGEAEAGYHWANLVQHAVAAGFVVLIVRQLKLPGALFAGLIFAVHPVQVESVAWISEQKNTLSALLGLGAVLAYLRYKEERRVPLYALASGLFLLALLTKTVVAVIPPALLVIAWWQRGRVAWKRDVVPLLPWLIAGMVLGLFSAWFERIYSHAQGEAFQVSLLQRTLIASRAICFYVRTLIWPANLMFINPRWSVDLNAPTAYAPLVFVLLVGSAAVAAARKWRGPLAIFLLFTGMLFPVLGFLDINWFNFSYVADHFVYLPSLALIVPLAAGVEWTLGRLRRKGVVEMIVKGALILILVLTARQHAADFRGPEILYARTIEKNPACWLAFHNLGAIELENSARLGEAMKHLERALQLKPDHARAHNDYGVALLRSGRAGEAVAEFRTALALQGGVAEVHVNLGQALVASGAPATEALVEFDEAIRLRRDYVDAYAARAEALARQPDAEARAIVAYEEALALAPARADLQLGLGSALLAMPERRREGVAHLREAIRLKPDFVEAWNNLGTALSADESTSAEAIEALTRAVQLAPGYADAHFNLGLMLTERPERRSEGLAHLREAIRLNPADVQMRTTLASQLARHPEELPEAVAQLTKVVELQPGVVQAQTNLANVLARMPGKVGEACEHYRRALALEPGNREARAGLAALEGKSP